MACDVPIDPKLLQYEATKDCFSHAFFCPITGRMGSGKTSTVISLMKSVFRKCFEDVIVVIPEISLHSIDEKDNIFAELPPENLYHEFNEENMTEIEKRCMENAREGYNTLLIIDDFGSRFKDAKSPEYKILKRMIIKIRHFHTSIFLLAQNIFQFEKAIREVATSILFFDLGVSQNEKVMREFLPYNEKQCEEIMSAFVNPHDHLLLNTYTHRVFRNMRDELVFPK
jgi:hypothetical protein